MGVKHSKTIGGIGRAQALTRMILGYVTLGSIVLTTLFWVVPAVLTGVGMGVAGATGS